jgi:hypothetical protein
VLQDFEIRFTFPDGTLNPEASFEKRRQQGWSTEITLWERVPG